MFRIGFGVLGTAVVAACAGEEVLRPVTDACTRSESPGTLASAIVLTVSSAVPPVISWNPLSCQVGQLQVWPQQTPSCWPDLFGTTRCAELVYIWRVNTGSDSLGWWEAGPSTITSPVVYGGLPVGAITSIVAGTIVPGDTLHVSVTRQSPDPRWGPQSALVRFVVGIGDIPPN